MPFGNLKKVMKSGLLTKGVRKISKGMKSKSFAKKYTGPKRLRKY